MLDKDHAVEISLIEFAQIKQFFDRSCVAESEENIVYPAEANFSLVESEFIQDKFLGIQNQKSGSFEDLMARFANQPEKAVMIMLHLQNIIPAREDFASRLAITKQSAEICKKRDFQFGLALSHEEQALILLESSHNFFLLEQQIQKILRDYDNFPNQDERSHLISKTNILLNLLIIESSLGRAEEVARIFNQIQQIFSENPDIGFNLHFELAATLPVIYLNMRNFPEVAKSAEWFLSGLKLAEDLNQNKDREKSGQDFLGQICLQKLRAYTQTFADKRTETEKNLAIAKAHQGDFLQINEMIAAQNSKEDGFTKWQILSNLYLELGRCLEHNQEIHIIPSSLSAEEIFTRSATLAHRAHLEYHAHEAEIELIYLEILKAKEDGEFNKNTIDELRERLFSCVSSLDPTGMSFGVSNETNSSFVISQISKIAAELYGGGEAQNQLSFLRDFFRRSAREIKFAMDEHLPLEDEKTEKSEKSRYKEFFTAGQKMFDFHQLHVFTGDKCVHREAKVEDEKNILNLDQLTGLQHELLQYAREQDFLTDDYQAVLKRIQMKGEVVQLNNFFLGSMFEEPFPQAIRTALLTFQGDNLVLVIRDPRCHEEYTSTEQIALSNLFSLLVPESEDTKIRLKKTLAEAEEKFIPRGSVEYAEPQQIASLVFAETVGATPVSQGDFLTIAAPHWLHGAACSTIDPIAVAVISKLSESAPGTTLMEQYLDASLEELMARDEDQLLELGILKKPLASYGDSLRNTVISAGSFAIKREFRSMLFQLTFSKLMYLIGQNSNEQSCKFIFVTVVEQLKKIYSKINLKYHTFGKANYDKFIEIASKQDNISVEGWQEYFYRDPEIIIFRADDCENLFRAQIENLTK